LNENLSLETHVAQRIENFKNADNTPNWYSVFWGSPTKSQVNSVIQKISFAISKEIIGSWSKIFHAPTSAKNITLDFGIDAEKEGLPYISFNISDGASQFALHERSLGFRWFFSFLLFTRFKQSKSRNTIFLFDEPAANLHARAQSELLKSFSKIVEGGNKIIYSTHSHYMIEPTWLSGAYIIENEATDYEKIDNIGALSTTQTNIKATRFVKFISDEPQRVSYYQPILEKLDYQEARLLNSKPVVVTEGISDFHAFRAALGEKYQSLPFDFIPGRGAGANGPMISMLLGYSRPFVILLDDDETGHKEAVRYRDEWLLGEETIITLGQIDEKFKGMDLEKLLGEDMHSLIVTHFGRESGLATKKEIGIFFAEMQYAKSKIKYPISFTKNIEKISDALSKFVQV
jgi:predicted ATP-dependent endonuclease of OLD family